MSGQAGRPLIYGEFLPTLDELVAAANGGRRNSDRVRIERGHVVLRHAEIYQGGLSTGPAGAVSSRHSRDATGDGLPLLPQLRRSGGALEFTQHANLHGVSHAGAEGQSETRTGARELENWSASRVGATASHARLRFLQSFRTRQSRDQLL